MVGRVDEFNRVPVAHRLSPEVQRVLRAQQERRLKEANGRADRANNPNRV
jgi:hypothetical protein